MESLDVLGLIGTTVAEKYLVEAAVDTGGSSLVYRATHLLLHRRVALKVFRAADMSDDARAALVEGFVREGALLAELSERSAAIVQARDVGTFTTPDGRWVPFIVLEWLDGETLERTLDREAAMSVPTRSLAEAMLLLDPVVEALALAHRRGVIHRDLKPSNLFLVRDGPGDGATLKLLDFGIAKVVEDVQAADAFKRTDVHLAAFTPAYGAPEQFSRSLGPTGPWTDVFGLALVLLEVVTRRPPLEGSTIAELGTSATRRSVRPSLARVAKARSPEVEGVFARAVTVEPSRRYAAIDTFWSDLKAAVLREAEASCETDLSSTLTAASVPEAPQAETARVTRSRSRAVALAGATAVLLLSAAGVAARFGGKWHRGGASPPAARRTTVAAATAAAPTSPPASVEPTCPEGMIRIPASRFLMGSDEREVEDDERPAHRVELASYCIDRTEVTTEAYAACASSGACEGVWNTNSWPDITKNDERTLKPVCNAVEETRRSTHPVNCVSWAQARAYCMARGARLPTEAEWELAARGTDGRRFPWGDAEPTVLRLNACGSECAAWGKRHGLELPAMFREDDGWPTTAPVGSFPAGASPFGVLDMTGNVWEWTEDRYGPYDATRAVNPSGAREGAERVVRGGAWNGAEGAWVRPTFRFHSTPDVHSHGIGFRCAGEATPSRPPNSVPSR